MERVAAMAGQPHCDEPLTSCPVLAAFTRALNDRIPTTEWRSRVLGPRHVALLSTRAHPEIARARAYAVADETVRRFASAVCERHGHTESALELAMCDEVEDRPSATMARLALSKVIDRHAGIATDLHAALWTVSMAARDTVSPTLWVGGAIRAVEAIEGRDPTAGKEPGSWALVAGETLDRLIALPRADGTLYWPGDQTALR